MNRGLSFCPRHRPTVRLPFSYFPYHSSPHLPFDKLHCRSIIAHMDRRLIAGALAALLLACPVLVSAQSASTATNVSYSATIQQLIAVYTQLIRLLEQEIASLIAVQGASTAPATNLDASPSSGTAPLTVNFWYSSAIPNDAIDFGDGSPLFSLNGYCSSALMGNACGANHTYTSAGTYAVRLVTVNCTEGGSCGPARTVISTATITVTGGGTTPSATIDQSLLTTMPGTPAITGKFSGSSPLNIAVYVVQGTQMLPAQYQGPGSINAIATGPQQAYVHGQVTFPGSMLANGRYSIQLSSSNGTALQPGTYTVGIYSNSYLLTTGTLNVKAPTN